MRGSTEESQGLLGYFRKAVDRAAGPFAGGALRLGEILHSNIGAVSALFAGALVVAALFARR